MPDWFPGLVILLIVLLPLLLVAVVDAPHLLYNWRRRRVYRLLDAPEQPPLLRTLSLWAGVALLYLGLLLLGVAFNHAGARLGVVMLVVGGLLVTGPARLRGWLHWIAGISGIAGVSGIAGISGVAGITRIARIARYRPGWLRRAKRKHGGGLLAIYPIAATRQGYQPPRDLAPPRSTPALTPESRRAQSLRLDDEIVLDYRLHYDNSPDYLDPGGGIN